jgi:ABC-type antimicrobial peptide transport system permease subunit
MLALVIFGAIAMLLAGIGIYGVVSYSVVTRTHEIGVRMALGATPARIRRAVLGEATLTALSGVTAGVAIAIAATRYLQSLLFGVTRLDPLTYAAGAVLLLVTSLVAAYVPAWRSSRVEPTQAIREG